MSNPSRSFMTLARFLGAVALRVSTMPPAFSAFSTFVHAAQLIMQPMSLASAYLRTQSMSVMSSFSYPSHTSVKKYLSLDDWVLAIWTSLPSWPLAPVTRMFMMFKILIPRSCLLCSSR